MMGIKPLTAAMHDGDGHQHREATWFRTTRPHTIWAWHSGFNSDARVARKPMFELCYQNGRNEAARDGDPTIASQNGSSSVLFFAG